MEMWVKHSEDQRGVCVIGDWFKQPQLDRVRLIRAWGALANQVLTCHALYQLLPLYNKPINHHLPVSLYWRIPEKAISGGMCYGPLLQSA